MVVSFLRADLGQVLVLKLADILSPMLDEAVAPCALERPVSTEASDGLIWLGAGRARLFEGPPRAVLSALDGDVGVDDVGVPVARVVLLLGAVDDGVPGEALEVFLAPALERLRPRISRWALDSSWASSRMICRCTTGTVGFQSRRPVCFAVFVSTGIS